MTERMRGTAVAGPISLWLTRVVAIAGLAGVVGVAHSLFVPVYLSRQTEAKALVPSGGDADPDQDGSQAQGQPSDTDTDSSDAGSSGNGPAAVVPLPADPAQADLVVGEEAYPPGYVGLAGGYELFERAQMGEPVWFLDARRPDEFEQGRIAGAILMPANRVNSAEGLEDLAFVDPTSSLVIYCVGGDCDASENSAILLEQLGYADIVIMKAGYEDWVAAGYPVEP